MHRRQVFKHGGLKYLCIPTTVSDQPSKTQSSESTFRAIRQDSGGHSRSTFFIGISHHAFIGSNFSSELSTFSTHCILHSMPSTHMIAPISALTTPFYNGPICKGTLNILVTRLGTALCPIIYSWEFVVFSCSRGVYICTTPRRSTIPSVMVIVAIIVTVAIGSSATTATAALATAATSTTTSGTSSTISIVVVGRRLLFYEKFGIRITLQSISLSITVQSPISPLCQMQEFHVINHLRTTFKTEINSLHMIRKIIARS